MSFIRVEKTFKDRGELDAYVRSTFGTEQVQNKDITLEIEEDKLKELSLSEDVTVYGVKIKKIKVEEDISK